jgi:hypothetical protein
MPPRGLRNRCLNALKPDEFVSMGRLEFPKRPRKGPGKMTSLLRPVQFDKVLPVSVRGRRRVVRKTGPIVHAEDVG